MSRIGANFKIFMLRVSSVEVAFYNVKGVVRIILGTICCNIIVKKFVLKMI